MRRGNSAVVCMKPFHMVKFSPNAVGRGVGRFGEVAKNFVLKGIERLLQLRRSAAEIKLVSKAILLILRSCLISSKPT